MLSQGNPLADPSVWEQFGPFGIVFVVMTFMGGGIIFWLLRDRVRLIAERDAAYAEARAADAKLLEQAGILLPAAQTMTTVAEGLADVASEVALTLRAQQYGPPRLT